MVPQQYSLWSVGRGEVSYAVLNGMGLLRVQPVRVILHLHHLPAAGFWARQQKEMTFHYGTKKWSAFVLEVCSLIGEFYHSVVLVQPYVCLYFQNCVFPSSLKNCFSFNGKQYEEH